MEYMRYEDENNDKITVLLFYDHDNDKETEKEETSSKGDLEYYRDSTNVLQGDVDVENYVAFDGINDACIYNYISYKTRGYTGIEGITLKDVYSMLVGVSTTVLCVIIWKNHVRLVRRISFKCF